MPGHHGYTPEHTHCFRSRQVLRPNIHDVPSITEGYVTGVLPQVVDAVVSKQRLLQAIYAVPGSKTLPPEEDCITYALCPSVIWHIHRSDQLAAWLLIDCRELVRNGLLIAKGSDAFLFSVPHASKFVDSVIKGRKELVQLVKRRKYSEIPQRVGSRAFTNRAYGLICAPV